PARTWGRRWRPGTWRTASSPARGTPGGSASPTAPGPTTRGSRSRPTRSASSATRCRWKSPTRSPARPPEAPHDPPARVAVRRPGRSIGARRPGQPTALTAEPTPAGAEVGAGRRDEAAHGGATPGERPRAGEAPAAGAGRPGGVDVRPRAGALDRGDGQPAD